VLKSWAIPKGPTLKPGEKRLAMMVEDHPFEYKDFEGIIPEGNYGAGTVMIWDRGTYHSAGSADRAKSEQELNEGLNKGHISFLLDGQKLKGEFALVKLKKPKEENAWLLIKANDENATDQNITKYDKSAATGKSMEEIKNSADEIWSSPVSKIDLSDAPAGKIPDQVKPMLATLVKEPFNDTNWLFEIKWDGYRALAIKSNKEVKILSRNQRLLNDKFKQVKEAVENIEGNFILDGEIVVLDKYGRPKFNLIQNYSPGKNGTLIYYVFDILYLNGHLLESLTLYGRRKILSKFLLDNPIIKISKVIVGNGIDFFAAAKNQNLEGIIAKNGTSIYREGVRSKEWLKIKTHQTNEAVIGGFTEPEIGRHFLGALLLGVYKNDSLYYIGSVGTGFDDDTAIDLKSRLISLQQSDSPFVNLTRNKYTTWVKPELVCEIKFQEWTNFSIRQPVFLGLREDKNPREVTREYPGSRGK
jgi:bifunctional non-homologous end joining protein LigD